MDINYELYKVFYYVASSLSFSDASKKLFISQSAVSQSIKTLERKLGQPLFIRSTKKVQLTPAGALLLKHVEPAMNLISRGESQLLESGSLGLGQLHIGASDTTCRYFLLPYLQKFHRKFPDVPIKITNASSMGCVDLLEQRRVDLIITNFPNPHLNPSYIQKTVGSFSDVFVANPAYFDLADRIVPFSELGTYPLMMLDRKSTTSEFLHHIFLQHQLELLPQVELSSNDLLIDMARIGLGIAFIPDFCLKHKPEDLFLVRTQETIPQRQLVASLNPTLPVSASTEEFLKPEPAHFFPQLWQTTDASLFPFSRKKRSVFALQETFIQQKDHAAVLAGPDHAPCCLQDFVHSRIAERIVKSGQSPLIIIIL